MRTCLDRLISQSELNSKIVREEVEFVTSRLEQCRHDGKISNEAFLDAGVIQGALEMIANHIEMGVPNNEVVDLIQQQLGRADRLEIKHPGLNEAVEEGR